MTVLSRWVAKTNMHRCLWLTSIKAYDAIGNEDILFPPLATLGFFGLCQLEECFIILRVFVAFSIANGFRGAKGAPTHFHLLSPPLSLSTELFLVGESKLICHSRKKRTVKSQFFPVQGSYSGMLTLSWFASAASALVILWWLLSLPSLQG